MLCVKYILAWNFLGDSKKKAPKCDVAFCFLVNVRGKTHFNTQCPIQSELRAIYHENKHEDHGCTSDDTVVIVSSCAQCALAKLHNAAF